MKRRTFLGAALAMAALPFAARASAERAAFQQSEVAAALQELFGVSDYETSEAVQFRAPEIAENGAVVPLTASYDGAASRIAFVVQNNPAPLAAVFSLSAASVPHVATRIKMSDSSIVHAVVQTADGRVLGTAKDVKVTIGGCGG